MADQMERGAPIRVLIAEDHTIVRKGLRFMLDTKPGIQVVGEAKDGEQAVRRALALDPDVILLDLVMPRKDGMAAIEEIKRQNLRARILVLTSFAGDDKVFAAIKAGAHGYLLKDSTPDELLRAIRTVHQGEPFLSPIIAFKLVRELGQPSDSPSARNPLSPREIDVLQLLAQGISDQDIARRMGISKRTVNSHVSRILDKLHLANRTQAALYALRRGLAGSDGDPLDPLPSQ